MRFMLLFVTLLLSACASIAPKQIHLDRVSLNEAISSTNNEQLLINIVRLRYLEDISFLKISNVTSSFKYTTSFDASLGATPSIGANPGVSVPLSLMPKISFLDNPTISYTPIASEEFTRQLLTPISLSNLSLLLSGGAHDPELLLKLTVSSMNDLKNAVEATDLRIASEPQFKTYYRLIEAIRALMVQGGLDILPYYLNRKNTLALRINKGFTQSKEAKLIRQLLKIPSQHHMLILSDDFRDRGGNVIHVRMRSVMGVLVFLSHGVEVPNAQIQANEALHYKVNNEVYNWEPLLKDIQLISHSDKEPVAFVKAKVHNTWYYIARSDLNSITTFNFLHSLIILSAGNSLNGTGHGPILTIPAG